MPRWARILLGLAAAGTLAGGLVLWSGIVNIGASTGHWAITDWLLHTAMRRSVNTHALGLEVPPLDDPALVRRGAGHYAQGCAACHGAPGRSRSAVVTGMTPVPPRLIERVPRWQPEELFWIVRHGVKFTGMPAWPALQRRDEVWAMVAFLRHLPGLDESEYQALAFGEIPGPTTPDGSPAGGAFLAAEAGCTACHGSDGAGSGAFPRLAGQSVGYLHASLTAYADGRRHSGFMQAAVSGLDDAALRRLAEHYAAAGAPRGGPPAAGEATLGADLARRGDAAAGVPACAACHGLAQGPRFAAYPTLAGQQAWYLARQLRLFRDGHRGGTAYAHIMRAIAGRLSDAQIDALAAYYAGL